MSHSYIYLEFFSQTLFAIVLVRMNCLNIVMVDLRGIA